MAGNLGRRLGQRRKESLAKLKLDIEIRGKIAAVEFAEAKFLGVPRHGALDHLIEKLLDAAIRFDQVTEAELIALLVSPRHNRRAREWISRNISSQSSAVLAISKKVILDEIVIDARSGPKVKADSALHVIAWQIAQDLREIGFAAHYGERINYKKILTAAEVISDAAGSDISVSLARDWIVAGQKLVAE